MKTKDELIHTYCDWHNMSVNEVIFKPFNIYQMLEEYSNQQNKELIEALQDLRAFKNIKIYQISIL